MRIQGIRKTELGGALALGLALGGCNSFDEAPGPASTEPRLVIPLDERPAVAAPQTPLSVSGGTLRVMADGSAALVADPERDSLSIVDLLTLGVRHTISLEPGDEPGRSVEDGQKRIHVALRGSGAVVAVDALSGAVVSRRAVCKAPRGIAFDAATGLVHVACAEGKLVSLAAQSGEVVRSLTLEPDLRDVLVRGSELWVTSFKSAEVLRVSSLGELGRRITIPARPGTLSRPAPKGDTSGGLFSTPVTLKPGVAWRAVPTATGGAVVVHQQAVVDDIEITEPSAQGSAYGGGGLDCGGIVKNVVSNVAADGAVTSASFTGAPLPVDVAVSPDQTRVAIAHAGMLDFAAPRPFLVFPSQGGDDFGGASGGPVSSFSNGGLSVLSLQATGSAPDCQFPETGQIAEPVVAVAFAPDGRLLAQTREPPKLLVIQAGEVPWGLPATILLPGASRFDTGHELFHRDSGGGIACASCHPEGGEDGHTWSFAGTGKRRTQALHVGLRDTAPFHWNGDLANVGELMTDVFVGRMGGVKQTEPRLGTLSEWLFSLKPPPAIRDATDAAALRGQELFNAASVGCVTCHSGSKLTNNDSVAVDSLAAQKLQVPSLVAIGYRAPFMHTGCATTLTARFDPACGGNQHGDTSALTEAQLGDLVAYMEAL